MKAVAAVLFCALNMVGVMTSDLLIRAHGLDGKFGISATAYDLYFSIGWGIGMALLIIEIARKGD